MQHWSCTGCTYIANHFRCRSQHEHREHISQLVRHMRSFGLYTDMIELTYLNLTQTFYTKESADLVQGGKKPATDFLSHVQTRIQEEDGRAQEVLSDVSVALVRDTTRTALLSNRLQWLAKDG